MWRGRQRGRGLEKSVKIRYKVKRKLTLLVRNTIRDLQQVHIAKWYAHILGLATSKATSKVGVAKHARRTTTVHSTLSSIGVSLLTLRRKLLLAEEAITTSNLERSDVSLANFNTGDSCADLVDDTAELVAQDVAFAELDDCAMEEMQV